MTTPVNILLVDDEPRNLDVLESILETDDHRLVRAQTAEVALLELVRGEFACIVLDIQMPDMNGIELARLIKTRKRSQFIPILFLTAYYQEEKHVLQGYGAGAVDYLTKPINPEVLRSKVGIFVELFRATRALASANDALQQEIAQRERAEEALRKANLDLEARVQERTADLIRTNGELRESEERFRTMAHAAPVMIWMSGPDKLCNYFNQPWLEFTGRTLEQELGNGWAEGVHPEDLSCCLETYVQSFDQRKPFEMEYRLRRADGEYRWIIDHGVPRFRPDGSFLGYIGSCKDFTSRREAEAVLIKSHDELESRVRLRTAELVQSNRELENQIRERRHLEALVLSISEREQQRIGQDLHDGLCQQLTGIKFRSGLLEQKLAKRGLAEATDAHAIEALLSQAIEQARGQARGLNPVRLEADGLMTALQELAGSIADVFGIQCICDSGKPVLLQDHAVAIHLYRIAQEAITNAIKHGQAGQVRLRLAERDDHICLEIHDDGIGFPAAPQKNGGIGLHIMNYRAHTIGAALEVQSAGRDGTLVICSLPKPQLERATQE